MKNIKIVLYYFLIFFLTSSSSLAQPKQFKALVVTTTNGWHHESLHYGVLALKKLGVKNNFDVVVFENPKGFTDKNLEQFQVIIFLNTTANIFDTTQQAVMERFIKSGKGFVGIHSASDTEYDWDWYTKLVGRMFHIHPVIQTAKIKIIENDFPGLQGFSGTNLWTDEWYEFGAERVSGLKYILAVDESSYNPKVEWKEKGISGNGMGKLHPVSWYHNFDGGRSFYTALGHLSAIYQDEKFLNHLYAGIYWAALDKK